MGKLTISMAIFNSYVKLPEGISFSYWWNPVCMKRLKRFSLMFYSRMDIESQLGLNEQLLLLFFGLIFSTRSHTKCRTQLPKKSAIGQVVLRQRLRSDGTKRVCRKEVLGNWCLSQAVHRVIERFQCVQIYPNILTISYSEDIDITTILITISQISYISKYHYDIPNGDFFSPKSINYYGAHHNPQ